MRFADSDNFPSVGLAMWWALQTVTTVGYGGVVPTTVFGRVIEKARFRGPSVDATSRLTSQ